MTELEKIIAQHINLSLENTKDLDQVIKEKKLTDYQFFTSRVFLGLKTMSSLLIFWDTGFGKTLLALYIIKNITFNYPSWRIFIFVKASLHDMWKDSVQEYCNKKVDILHYDDINIFMKFKNKIENYKNKKDRVLIVVDEAHNFILRNKEKDFSNRERKINRLFKLIRNVSGEKYNKLILMTATPIVNDIKEFNLLVDLMRKGVLLFDEKYFVNEKLVNINELEKCLYAICSYKKVDTDSLSNTLENENFASKSIFIKKILMSGYQENFFIEAEKYERKNIEIYNLKPIRRMVSTFVFNGLKLKDGMTEEAYNNLIKEKLQSFTKYTETLDFDENLIYLFKNEKEILNEDFVLLNNFSCKYMETCRIILNSKGKCLVYEPFVSFEGIATLKCYFNVFKISYIEYSKFSSTREKKFLEFNREENIDGNLIKCCIFSNAGSEGVSFSCINDMVILDIPWSEANLRQIIGRSLRYKSHNLTPRKYVNVHILLAFTKSGQSSDNEMFNIIQKKTNRIRQIHNILKETSIESIYTRYSTLEPIEEEYIFDSIKRVKVDFKEETTLYELKKVIKIKYVSNNMVEKGYLEIKTKTIFDENMRLVGKVKENEDGDFEIIEINKELVYEIDNV